MVGRSHQKRLVLKFHGRVLEQLGIQSYLTPVPSIAEMISNGWDADAKLVDVTLPRAVSGNARIVVKDDGDGMTFDECQNCFLNVGWNRRGDDPDSCTKWGRAILGRKGIGKFAGFGIAKVLDIDTVSRENGERTRFRLNIDDLMGEKYVDTSDKPVDVIAYTPPSRARIKKHGTTVTLSKLTLDRAPSTTQFARSMSRRFLLPQLVDNFNIRVNRREIPEAFAPSKVQYLFPRDYTKDETPEKLTTVDEDGWGTEILPNGHPIRWRVMFFHDTIDEPELQGIAVFAKGKLCQAPYLFSVSGGMGGQHGVQYLAGQVVADYLDSLTEDIIAAERQRVRWEHPEAAPLQDWGQARIRQLLGIWSERRASDKIRRLDEKISSFNARLERLGTHEAKTVRRAIVKIAEIRTLSNEKFEELAGSVLTSWEQGRLRDLIESLSKSDESTSEAFVGVMAEAQVLSALNVAEAVKTKLLVIGGLKKRIREGDLETAVRDYVASNPWLVAPQFETFRIEKGVRHLLSTKRHEAGIDTGDWDGRVDLALSSGKQLLIVEFMRPGLALNWDHLARFERYVRLVSANVDGNTRGRFQHVEGYLVADKLERRAEILQKVRDLERDRMFAMDWDTLLSRAQEQWQDLLEILAERSSDERLKILLED
jgi:hypothetical protein